MARMAMMGRDSTRYHRRNVGLDAPRLGDPELDEASVSMRYFASHGETPLVWGGSGAMALGLSGAVGAAQYEALFAEGGALDPTTGERLVKTARPGMEIVVSSPLFRIRDLWAYAE